MQLGLGGAIRSRKATRKLAMFSKQWSPGDTLRVIYRVFKDENTERLEYLGGATWGYPVSDIKGLGLKTSFIPALCQFDSDGNPVGNPDILYRFSRLAPALVKARHEAEIVSAQSKPGIDAAMLRSVIREIDDKYDTKNNMKAIRPIIGRATQLIVVEALCIPFKDGKPFVDDALVVAMQPVSDALGDKLTNILNNPKYRPEEGDDFIEIEWQFPMATEKSESGRKVVPAGVDCELRIKNQFPEAWEKVKIAMGGMSTDSEMIVRRATTAVSEQRILNALNKYLIINDKDINNCGLTDELCDALEPSIGVIHELNLDHLVTDPKVKIILEKANAVNADVNASDLPPVKETVPTAPIVTPDGTPVPSIETLMGETPSTPLDEEFMQGIDLGALGAEE